MKPDTQTTLGQRQTIQEQQQEHTPRGDSPFWSLRLLHEPNNSDQSLLFVHQYLAACRVEPELGLLPRPCSAHLAGRGRLLYYRPNSCHQFLSVTDLRNSSQGEIDVRLGRPTRTTLLRAKQHRESLSARGYQSAREFLHRLHEIKRSTSVTESVRFDAVPNGESVHSFLTGARYNRYNADRNSNSPREQRDRGQSPQTEPPIPLPNSITIFGQRTTSADNEVRPHVHGAARPAKMVKNRRVTSRSAVESKPTPLMTIGIIGNTLSAKNLLSQPFSGQRIRRNTPQDARSGKDNIPKGHSSSPNNQIRPQVDPHIGHNSSPSNHVKPRFNHRENPYLLKDSTDSSGVMQEDHHVASDANSAPDNKLSGSVLISNDPISGIDLETIVQEKNTMKADDETTVVLREISFASPQFSVDDGSASHDTPTAEFLCETKTEEKNDHASDFDGTQESMSGDVNRPREADRENIDLADVPNIYKIEHFDRANHEISDETDIKAKVFTNKKHGLNIGDITDDTNALFDREESQTS